MNDPIKILLVEDDSIIALSTSKILKSRGHDVVIVHNGISSISAVRKDPSINIVLMDINLGNGIDGTEAAHKILEIRELPIIFLTNHSEKDVVEKVKKITSYGYVIKNSGEFVLLESINMALKLFEVNQKLKADISERVKTEKELKLSENRLSTIFHSSPVGICINTADTGMFIEINEAFINITGYNKEDVKGKDPKEIGLWYNGEELTRSEMTLQQTGKISNTELRFRKKNGDIGFAMISSEFIELNGNQCVLTLVNDITETKTVANALLESKTRFWSFFNNAESIIWIKDLEGRFLDINSYTEKSLNIKRELIIGKTIKEVFNDYKGEYYTDNDEAVIETGKIHVFEEKTNIFGDNRIYLSTKFPIIDTLGNFNAIGAICADITKLKKTEHEKEAILKAVPDILFKIDKDGVFLGYQCNNENELYQEPQHFLGKKMTEVLPQNIAKTALENLNKAVTDNEMQIFEYDLKIGGDVKYYENRIVPLNDESVLFIIRNITDDRNNRLELLRMEKISSIISISAEKIFEQGINKTSIDYMLSELGKAFNISRAYIFRKTDDNKEEIIVKQIFEWCNENIISSAEVLNVDSFSIPKGTKYSEKVEKMLKEGYLSAKSSNVIDEYENYLMEVQNLRSYIFIPIFVNNAWWGLIGFDECMYEREWSEQEIKALKTASNILGGALQKDQAETELAESKQLYYTLVNASPDSVSVTDLKGDLIFSSKKALELYGYEPGADLKGINILNWVTDESKQKAIDRFTYLIANNTSETEIYTLRKNNGTEFLSEITASCYCDDENNPKGLILVSRDITNRLIEEQKLAEESIRRKILIDGSSDGIVVLDENGKVFEANRKFSEMLGFEPSEIKDLYVWDWNAENDKRELLKFLSEENESGCNFETKHMKKDGSVFDVEISSNSAISNGKKLIFCVCRDITLKNAAQKKIRENEERFSKIFHSSPIGISITSVDDGRYIDVNEALLNIGGYSRDEVIGNSAIDLKVYDKKTRDKYVVMLEKYGKLNNEEIIYKKRDGTYANVIISMEIIDINGEKNILGTAIDITDKKESEIKILRSLTEKDILLKELQHRVKNNLSVISSLLHLELENLEDENSRKIFQNSITRINSLSTIYEQLYSTDDISKVDLNFYLSNLILSLESTYKINENIIFITTVKEDTFIDLKRSVLIGLIFNELLSNSMKYAYPHNANGTIKAGFTIESGFARMYVKDYGAGIPDGYEIESGKSLGLKLVKMLTEQLEGELKIISSNGTHTEITFAV